jgi:hypothetical protein
MKKICFKWSKMNRSGVRLGVGASDNNQWQLVKFAGWMEYTCGVKSETIKLVSIVPLRCAQTSFLSKDMLSCILRVCLEYVYRVSGYDTPTQYRLDSLQMPGWLDCWSWNWLRRVEKLTVILLWNRLKISPYGWFIEYPKSFRDCSIRCASNRQTSNNLNQTWKCTRTWTHGSCLQISLSQFHEDYIQSPAALTDSHKRIYSPAEFG